MKKKLLAGLATGVVMLSMVGMAEATSMAPSSSFTARLIYDQNFLVGSSGYEGTAWNSSFLSVKEGTSDRVAFEYFIGDLTLSSNVTLDLSILNLDDPNFSNLSLYAYEANGLANASDYFNTDTYVSTFSDYGAAGTNSYSLNVTSIFNDFTSNGNEYLGLLLKADDTDARYSIYSPTLEVAPVPEPATMILFGIGLAGLAGCRIRRKKKA